LQFVVTMRLQLLSCVIIDEEIYESKYTHKSQLDTGYIYIDE
jgi:hypothetical protein